MAKLTSTRRPKVRHRVFAFLESAIPSDAISSAEAMPPADQAAHRDRGTGTWRWLFADAAGVAVAGPAVCFTSAKVAEDWLAIWSTRLRALGIAAVTLLDGEHAVYGPRSWTAPVSDEEDGDSSSVPGP